MAEKPICRKCNVAHWGFTKCEAAAAAGTREAELARQRNAAKVVPEATPPPGYERIGPGKFARIRPGGVHIQIAPGMFARAENYTETSPGKYVRKAS